jgi:hypothetical protein
MRTVTQAAVAAEDKSFEALPEQVREALGSLPVRRRRDCWRSASGSGSACWAS